MRKTQKLVCFAGTSVSDLQIMVGISKVIPHSVFRNKFNLPDNNSSRLYTVLQILKSKLHFPYKALNGRNK